MNNFQKRNKILNQQIFIEDMVEKKLDMYLPNEKVYGYRILIYRKK